MEIRPVALRGHVANASFKRFVGILLMPKIDRAHKNYLTPEIWEGTHLREIFYGTLIFQQSSMICIGRHAGGHTLARKRGKGRELLKPVEPLFFSLPCGVDKLLSPRGKREKGGGRGRRGRDACYKNPLLFISADAGVCKFLIGWAVMSKLLACILGCISVRDKYDEGIKEMCSTGIIFGRSKLLQSCSNFTLKPELKPTVTACSVGRDPQEVLYTGFVHTPSSDSKRRKTWYSG